MCGSGGITPVIFDFENRRGEWSALRPGYLTHGETSRLSVLKGEVEWTVEQFLTLWRRRESFASAGD
jgi:hypothetical protein